MRKKTDSTGRRLGRAAAPLFARATAQHATHAAESSSRRSSHHRPRRATEAAKVISMYAPAEVFINGRYQVTGTMTPSHGPEDEVRVLLGITRPGDLIEVKQDGNVWAFVRTEHGFKNKDTDKEHRASPESHWTDRTERSARRPSRRR